MDLNSGSGSANHSVPCLWPLWLVQRWAYDPIRTNKMHWDCLCNCYNWGISLFSWTCTWEDVNINISQWVWEAYEEWSWHNRKQRQEVMMTLRSDDIVWTPRSSLAGATPDSSLSCKLINSIFTLGPSGLGILSLASTHFQKDLVCLIWEKRELAHKRQCNLASLL